MADSGKGRAPRLAAGGIVVRHASPPLIAVVRSRGKAWVLPKGKLKPGEDARAAARREVEEETGHDVSVHEFLGAMSYPADGRVKVVRFWRMRARGGQARDLMPDISAVKWLPLKDAIGILSRDRERVFLETVGPAAVRAASQSARKAPARPASRPAPMAAARFAVPVPQRNARRPPLLRFTNAIRGLFGTTHATSPQRG